MRKKIMRKRILGFTLVELLAVILIIAVIALVVTPLVLNQIENAKKNTFIASAKNTIDAANLYVSKNASLPEDGFNIKNLDIKNKDKVQGLVFQNTKEEYILKSFTDGHYCATGSKNGLLVTKGNCSDQTDLYAALSLEVLDTTTRSATIKATASDDTGITGYSYCIEDCGNEANWIKSNEDIYKFESLKFSRKYEVHVRVTNRIDKVTEKTIDAVTKELPTASYSVSPSGWTKTKTVVITYPSNVENYIRLYSGVAKMNGQVIPIGEKIRIEGTTLEVLFETNGSIEAITSDGFNDTSPSTLTISQIDLEPPVINTLTVKSTNASYNVPTTTIVSDVKDNSGAIIQMYISNTGYEKDGIWEIYNTNKAWNVGGTINGETKTVYITYMDPIGNKVNRSVNYVLYNECGSGNTTTSYGSWGSCSKACGGGTQSRSETVKDNKTSKVCSTSTGTQSCNTQTCCSSTVDYQWDAWGACSKICGGGVQYRTVHKKSNYDGSYCGSYTQSQSCNTGSCDNPDNYDWSKSKACDAAAFQAIANNTTLFKNYIEHQQFRNAMYDCANVTANILRNTDGAWNALKQSSRYSLVSGNGSATSCTCKYNSNSSSAYKNCQKPACAGAYDQFSSGIIYGGRVLVLSASTDRYLGTKYDDDGFGKADNETKSVDYTYRSYFLLGSSYKVDSYRGWGSCNRTTNGNLDLNVCSGTWAERYNRQSLFLPNLRVGLYWYYDYDNGKSGSKIENHYYNATVYVQIFII